MLRKVRHPLRRPVTTMFPWALPPIAQAPNPISETWNPVDPNLRYFIGEFTDRREQVQRRRPRGWGLYGRPNRRRDAYQGCLSKVSEVGTPAAFTGTKADGLLHILRPGDFEKSSRDINICSYSMVP